jgi:hypothetical protein
MVEFPAKKRPLNRRAHKNQRVKGRKPLSRRGKMIGRFVLLAGMIMALTAFYFLLEHMRAGKNPASVRFQEAADASASDGTWQTMLGDSRATLQAQGGYYQIILSPPHSAVRRYSRGDIEADGAYLIFTPRPEMGRPESAGVRYYGLGVRTFPVQAQKQGSRLIWKAGPLTYMLPEEIRDNPREIDLQRLKNDHGLINPLFERAGADYIVWEPLETR